MSDPVWWYLNRATGSVVLVLFTVAVLLGVLATFSTQGRVVPRFVTQAMHRQIALVATALLAVHVVTAVVDTYVDIRWWQALWPLGATYQPLWLGLGAVALDLLAVVVVTSLLRTRIGLRGWQVVHLTTYAAWVAALVHGLGIGSDSSAPWSQVVTLACAGAVAAAVLARLAALAVRPGRREGVR